MRWLKLSQVSKGLAVAFLILVFLEIPLLASFKENGMIQIVNKTRPATGTETTLGLLIFAAVAIIGAEAARPRIRQVLSPDVSKLSVQQDSLSSSVGRMALLRDLIFAPIVLVLALVASMMMPYLLVKEVASKGIVSLPVKFWLVVSLYIVYAVARQSALSISKRRKRPITSTLPTYTYQREGITLDLKRKRAPAPSQRGFIGIASEPCIVSIRFDELEEIRALSYVEAQTFVQYEIGPDLQFALRGTKELYRYLNGEIERPSVYGHWGSLGTVLLLQGPNLFYLISVANTDVDELVATFKAYQPSAAHTAPTRGTLP